MTKTDPPVTDEQKPLWTDGEIIAMGLNVFPKINYSNSQGHKRRSFIQDLMRHRDIYEARLAALLKERDEAVTHLRRMFEGFDFESGIGKPEAADSENAWNFLSTQTPTDR